MYLCRSKRIFNPVSKRRMKKRIFYIISFLVIFCIEVLIALYVCDNFVRPYIGDVLVVVLVYSFVRIFLPTGDSENAVLCISFCLLYRSDAILSVGGNLRDYEPGGKNYSRIYVRLERHCLLCGGLRSDFLVRAYLSKEFIITGLL